MYIHCASCIHYHVFKNVESMYTCTLCIMYPLSYVAPNVESMYMYIVHVYHYHVCFVCHVLIIMWLQMVKDKCLMYMYSLSCVCIVIGLTCRFCVAGEG